MTTLVTIPETVVVFIPGGYGPGQNKIEVIKTLRYLSYMGLKEAKDLSETVGQHTLPVNMRLTVDAGHDFEDYCRILRNNGCEVGPSIHKILQSLRDLGAEALRLGEDEIANEILQMVLAEKLRKGF